VSVDRLEAEFVDTFPATMKPGVLYVSLEYRTCGHLCACGCGYEVTTPLSRAQWAFTFDGDDISLWPSVGNWTLPCRSHYIVDRGRVRWARTFSKAEVDRNRRRDRAALNARGSETFQLLPEGLSVADKESARDSRGWQDRIRACVHAVLDALRRH